MKYGKSPPDIVTYRHRGECSIYGDALHNFIVECLDNRGLSGPLYNVLECEEYGEMLLLSGKSP